MSRSNPAEAQKMVLWVIWLGITGAIVAYQFQFGHGMPFGGDARPAVGYPITWVAFAFLLGAGVVRWMVIPRIRGWRPVLIGMIIGLALSETVAFFGIFLYPADMAASKLTLFILALFSAVQFMPLYAGKIGPKAERQSPQSD